MKTKSRFFQTVCGMTTQRGLPGLVVIFSIVVMTGCDQKTSQQTNFTKADSLTETYLALQDTMLQVWNSMIHDDNRKIRAMHNILHELGISNPGQRAQFEEYQTRLNDLREMRYNQQSISDPNAVAEYDFASNALVTELVALAESQAEFTYNTTLQRLVESIRAADERVINFREEYDEIASRFNGFIDRNYNLLEDIRLDSLERKPLFQMAAE